MTDDPRPNARPVPDGELTGLEAVDKAFDDLAGRFNFDDPDAPGFGEAPVGLHALYDLFGRSSSKHLSNAGIGEQSKRDREVVDAVVAMVAKSYLYERKARP
jgi:hypothetical protein